jgi:hypothetical protein
MWAELLSLAALLALRHGLTGLSSEETPNGKKTAKDKTDKKAGYKLREVARHQNIQTEYM